MITIQVDFLDEGKFDKLIKYIDNNLVYGEAQEQMRILGHHTADNMRDIIDTSKKRPDKGSQKLEKAITAETLNTTAGVEVGIGRIEKLKQEAPYYEVLNDGGYIPNHGNFVALGAFAPGEPSPNPENFREGQWSKGAGKFTFKAKRPIEGINYISQSLIKLERELQDMLLKLGAEFLEGMSI